MTWGHANLALAEHIRELAAGAEAHLTGTLAVCAGSCGPGNIHLINGLYDCQRNREIQRESICCAAEFQ